MGIKTKAEGKNQGIEDREVSWNIRSYIDMWDSLWACHFVDAKANAQGSQANFPSHKDDLHQSDQGASASPEKQDAKIPVPSCAHLFVHSLILHFTEPGSSDSDEDEGQCKL